MHIERGTPIILLKFADVGGINTISEHKKLINSIGHVWFGKIGSKPSSNKLASYLKNGKGSLVLRSPKCVYYCEFDAFTESEPSNAEYPEYYKNLMPNRNFDIWFRIISMTEVVRMDLLENLVLESSRSPMHEALKRSMGSFFYTIARNDIII